MWDLTGGCPEDRGSQEWCLLSRITFKHRYVLRGVRENEKVYTCQPGLMGSSQAQNQEGSVQKVEVGMNYQRRGCRNITWVNILA